MNSVQEKDEFAQKPMKPKLVAWIKQALNNGASLEAWGRVMPEFGHGHRPEHSLYCLHLADITSPDRCTCPTRGSAFIPVSGERIGQTHSIAVTEEEFQSFLPLAATTVELTFFTPVSFGNETVRESGERFNGHSKFLDIHDSDGQLVARVEASTIRSPKLTITCVMPRMVVTYHNRAVVKTQVQTYRGKYTTNPRYVALTTTWSTAWQAYYAAN